MSPEMKRNWTNSNIEKTRFNREGPFVEGPFSVHSGTLLPADVGNDDYGAILMPSRKSKGCLPLVVTLYAFPFAQPAS